MIKFFKPSPPCTKTAEFWSCWVRTKKLLQDLLFSKVFTRESNPGLWLTPFRNIPPPWDRTSEPSVTCVLPSLSLLNIRCLGTFGLPEILQDSPLSNSRILAMPKTLADFSMVLALAAAASGSRCREGVGVGVDAEAAHEPILRGDHRDDRRDIHRGGRP